MYKLYVIPGSHACRTGILMLEHKGVPYRRVDIPTLLHPAVARLRGFNAGGETRRTGSGRTVAIRSGDSMATVPALAVGDERISTNRQIARFLDERHPDPPLFPVDPEQRAAVEEIESWANETLQMDARRLALGAAVRDPSDASRRTADGRMGYLLYRRRLLRRLITPMIGRFMFAVDEKAERDLLAGLPATLDRIDAWISDGLLGGPQLNAADLMVAPSLALILYRPDVQPFFDGRPALNLVDRVLPEPLSGVSDRS